MKNITLKAQKIEKGNAREIRKDLKIPCIIYGKDFENQCIAIEYQDFVKTFSAAGYSTIVDIELDKKKIPVLIHDIQKDPVLNEFTHVDFQAIKEDKEIHTHIPVHLEGESDAVKLLHGILIHNKESLEIKCLPKNLISEVRVDVSIIKDFHTTITVADLNMPETVFVYDAPEAVIASVSAPKGMKEDDKEEETTEGEGEGEAKAE
ncbi:MAG: 50S ribosomal protein L25 [Candidatus Gracilibacteria bacterium]|jgi:large subunit ribosomal protein L25|nr:50S ribosomal protein L25 [Candidatus Gracilibacteria bacterium]